MRPLSLLFILSVACQTPPETLERTDPQHLASGGGGGAPTLSDVSMAEHLLDGEQIYTRVEATCQGLGPGWIVEPLFGSGAPGQLSTYCRARWTDPLGSPPDVSGLPGAPVPEAVVVAPMTGPEFPSGVDFDLHSRSRTAPIDDLPPLQGPPARLALLDAMPQQGLDGSYFGSAPVYSDHGHRVATLARALVCDDDGDCAAELHGYSAMRYRYDASSSEASRGPGGEGAVGSQSDLAVSIYEAVSDWKADHTAGTAGPLVINISAGWHGHWGGEGTSPSGYDAAVSAVFEALGYASCEGALVFAAAGNLGGLSNDVHEPLYPAAWERFDAPNAATCASRYGVSLVSGPAPRKQLVYGVGGVAADAANTPMGMSRPGSVPPLVAAGTYLGFYNPAQNDLMKPVSGTSASTAVVSASAAVVRAYRTLTPHQTVAKLQDGALAYAPGWTGPAPDYCPSAGPECAQTHVVTPCHSLLAACAGGACAVPPGTCQADPALHLLHATRPVDDFTWEPQTPGTCPNTKIDPTPPLGLPNQASECPIKQLDGVPVRPMTLPMPPRDPCDPYCELFIESDPPRFHFSIGVNPISDSSIVATFANRNRKTYEVGALSETEKVTLEAWSGLTNDPNNPLVSAVFTYSYDGVSTAGSTELVIVND